MQRREGTAAQLCSRRRCSAWHERCWVLVMAVRHKTDVMPPLMHAAPGRSSMPIAVVSEIECWPCHVQPTDFACLCLPTCPPALLCNQ